MNIRATLKSNDGFTLIELMMATVVFSTGLVALLSAVISLTQLQTYIDHNAITSNYINFILEDVQRNSGDLEDPGGYTPSSLVLDANNNFTIPGLGQAALEVETVIDGVETNILSTPMAGAPNPVEIHVQLTVTGPQGRAVQYTASASVTY